MSNEGAKELIRKTFQNPFDKQRFHVFIKDLLNQIEDSEKDRFICQGQYVPEAYRQYIKSYERIGKYLDPEEKKIDILVVYLQKERSLEIARSMQRNFIARYLNGSRGGEYKDAALVAFVAPNSEDWRFSLVKMEYKFIETPNGQIKVKEEFTPARRWSFLVGKNENSHTAQSRLAPIIAEDEFNPNLTQLEEAFNIEKVTKEFFEKYRGLFIWVKEELEAQLNENKTIQQEFTEKKVNTIDFSKKLLGQIVFLYFLQKKGWFGVERDKKWGTGSKNFLRELFLKKHGNYGNFFNDVLEPLFYEALARERDEDFYSRFNCKIPFLNGGLFDPINNYDWVHTDILIPNEVFSNNVKTKEGDIGNGLLDIFDRYNFTVKEDEPLEKEVAIDPEMLGKVFENLLEVKDRKSKGTYYTPREIVHYMCQQSLINYLCTELNQNPSTHERVGDDQFNLLGNETKEGQLDITIENTSDPVTPKEDIEIFIKYCEQVNEHDAHVTARGDETETYAFKMPTSILNNIKTIDEKLGAIKICDPAVGSGAFLVGMMTEIIRARNYLSKQMGFQYRTRYELKRDCIELSLYGVDIDPGAVEIAKLRLWLSLVVDEEEINRIKPLPNLDYKVVCGNSLLGVEINIFNQQLFADLELLKPLYFSETNPTKKQEYKKQIDELINQITNGHKEFDFNVYYSEVFHQRGGFDVVIGNPPYGSDLSVKEKSSLDTRFSRYRSPAKNSAIYFIYIADELLNKIGVNSYIVPKSLCYSVGWNKCAQFIVGSLCKLIDMGKAFDQVLLEQVVIIRNKGLTPDSFVNGLFANKIIREFEFVPKIIFNKYDVLLAGQSAFEIKIIDKILRNHSQIWGQYVNIDRGLNWQSKASKYKGKTPIYRGAQLDKYSLSTPTDFINPDKFSKDDYTYQLKPKILNQLAIAHVMNPYPHFFLQANFDEEGSILVYETISCTFIKNKKLDIKFALGFNNSKLFAWLLYKFVFSNAIRSTRYDEQYVCKIPVPEFEEVDQHLIVNIVNKILAEKQHALDVNTSALEAQIDHLVYELYGLTKEDIAIIEGKGMVEQ